MRLLKAMTVIGMKKAIAVILVVLVPFQILAADVIFKKSKVVVFPKDSDSKSKEEKAFITFGDSMVVVQGITDDYAARTSIPYKKIDQMIYERSSHSRIAAAILLSPLALFIKRKHHWFTFHYELEDSTKAFLLLRLDKKDEKRFRQVATVKTKRDVENIVE